jgi:hypothetical protein
VYVGAFPVGAGSLMPVSCPFRRSTSGLGAPVYQGFCATPP